MPELRIEIPGVPPSVGHYNAYRVVIPRHGKPFVQCYPTAQAKKWKELVAYSAAGRQIRGSTYVVSYVVYLPSAHLTDVDNFGKCILDGIAEAGVIDNDKHVDDLHAYRRIDRVNPRTIIIVRTQQAALFTNLEA